ncbi:MAG TPA: hemerythrin domain-containing protein [Leptospiraceae bacterium]|jgi:hemerythrin-like domain-containing protein|nr:hemerythrin domain-containing protein [Chitinophagales bacterium]HMU99360.1 hemerythrin domain-containing protein [Chitinophagales bacterium]HMV03872.1 hemerythrin domain-containing protein [Chitinophagales bacterium]HNB39833.1 hemerythrin domain-containing protein [Chitinophagales bacterium]HNC59793.1 hemerythrin domain-containing protein [Leptospiraceae bacterium]
MHNYETVSEAINDLIKRGYKHDFNIHLEEECLVCNKTMTQLSPDDFEIDETYRFEGNTDPGDEMILFAISSKKHRIKGTLLNAYGLYSDSAATKIVEKLENHITTIKPLKRAEYLKALSREHHHGLLLCWKIKTGFSKGVSVERMKLYLDWFFKNHLQPHFEMEEKYIFPILGNENVLIKQAVEEHKIITALFCNTSQVEISIKQIQVDLEKHIRFEERVLFDKIQNAASPENMDVIKKLHSSEKFIDNTSDVFWE